MFLGTHQPRLDEKGRLFLPAKYREDLAGGVVITKGQERCLFVWPREEFARITEKLRNAPVTDKASRDYSRVLFSGASSTTALHCTPHSSTVNAEKGGIWTQRLTNGQVERRGAEWGDIGRPWPAAPGGAYGSPERSAGLWE